MSTPIHITPKEALVLRTFAASQYYGGPGTATWLPDVTENCGLSPQSFAAVYGSLVAKGIMLTRRNDPHDTCEMSAAGEEILQALLGESALGAGPFDAEARAAGFTGTVLPITPASVLYAVHGPDGAEEPKLGDLDWLRLLLRSCQNPGAIEALDGKDGDPDATSMMLRGVEDLYRRLATLTGGNPAIYDSERAA